MCIPQTYSHTASALKSYKVVLHKSSFVICWASFKAFLENCGMYFGSSSALVSKVVNFVTCPQSLVLPSTTHFAAQSEDS